jgi:hypothetical protein
MAKLSAMIQGTGATVFASRKIQEFSYNGNWNFTYLLDANYKQDIDDNRHNIDDYEINVPTI